MGLERQKQLLDYLIKAPNQWIYAQKLADALGVSTRQVRKYVSAINDKKSDSDFIKSSSKGYFLDYDRYFEYTEIVAQKELSTPKARQNYIIQRLTSLEGGCDIFDLAEELFVSEATIESDLTAIRKKLREYELRQARIKDFVKIEGRETAKRKFLREVVLSDSYDDLVLKDEIELLSSRYKFWNLRRDVSQILAQESGLFTNDYTLNNIVLHIIVMIDRIKSGGTIIDGDVNEDVSEKTAQYSTAANLADYIRDIYNIQVSDAEVYYLVAIITNNASVIDFNSVDITTIDQYIDSEHIDYTKNILRKVERIYRLGTFGDDFTMRFIVHMSNLFKRSQFGGVVRNPLKSKMKLAYPLIYNIAVFIAQEIKNDYRLHLSEDDIAFIALHIGGYFENTLSYASRVTCAFIYTDYNGTYKGVLDKISRIFADSLYIKHVISPHQYKTENIEADIIISTIDMHFSDRHIIINPFLKDSDIEKIRSVITHIAQKGRFAALKAYLLNFASSELFYKNPNFTDKIEAMTFMAENAINLGYANQSLTENVLQREALSDTAFYNVAVPHSVGDDALKSFLSFAIFEEPLQWGDKHVSIVLLIGINNDSRKVFTEVFDLVVEILSEGKIVKELALSSDYKDFFQSLITYIEKIGQ
jgi:lichenan operon transcriptional antiterminator